MLTLEQILETAREIITTAPYCFLITTDSQGGTHARLMEHFSPEADLTMWFGTHPHSRKISDLSAPSPVVVTFEKSAERAYTVVYGMGEVVTDMEKRFMYWREGWEQFFAGGAGGPNYTLVKVIPQRIEVINFEKGVVPTDAQGIHIPQLMRGASGWMMV